MQNQKGRKRNKTQLRRNGSKKRAEQSRVEQAEESEDDKAFISNEAYSLWEKNLSDKGFIGERGFDKFISPFVEIIKKRGWSLFCKHKPPGFAAVVREFYANMAEMKEDSVYVRGIWVPMGHERINEIFKSKILRMDLSTKTCLRNLTMRRSWIS